MKAGDLVKVIHPCSGSVLDALYYVEETEPDPLGRTELRIPTILKEEGHEIVQCYCYCQEYWELVK